MRAFWPVLYTLGIHQGHETSGHFPSKHGSPNDHLHRQHTTDGRVCSTSDTSLGSPTVPVDRLGIHYHVPKSVKSMSSDGVPAPTGRVAYLQQKFGSANLSGKAKELLLASWRSTS